MHCNTCMGFSIRRADSKATILPCASENIKEEFLIEVQCTMGMEEILSALVINWDQTACTHTHTHTHTHRLGGKLIKRYASVQYISSAQKHRRLGFQLDT